MKKRAYVGPKPPLKPKQVWSIHLTLQRESRIRDLALCDLTIDSKLRGCDLVQLRVGQLVINAAARHRATIVHQKTGKPVQFELTEQIRESLIAWLTHCEGGLQDFVFPSRMDGGDHISTRQHARLIGDWVESIGLGRSAYSTRSLRHTKVALIYKRTGNLRAMQILLSHTKLDTDRTTAALKLVATDLSPTAAAHQLGLGRSTVYREINRAGVHHRIT